MDFPGFEPEDFDLFALPDFASRMEAIRGRLRPKLTALGEKLSAAIAADTGLPTYPHVAQHMRRRVNPPVETWVAFTRDRKGYKRWTHYRVAVSGSGVRVTVFVEDDSDDKTRFGAILRSSAERLRGEIGTAAPVVWYTLGGDAPVRQADVTPRALAACGAALERLKTAKFQAGVPLARDEAVGLAPAEFENWAMDQVRLLKPLYLAGAMD
jgi:uncharacterized protein YktB (UPF0637 family)